MFRSIHWKLIASYVLLTLLAVSLVGVLALSLVKQQVDRQEREYLTANAEGVARQALPLARLGVGDSGLNGLARAAAFLGNARVRILDRYGRVLADSGSPRNIDELVWIQPPLGLEPDPSDPAAFDPTLMALAHGELPMHLRTLDLRGQFPLLHELPPGTRLTIVQRTVVPWGHRFVFEIEPAPNPDASPVSAPAPEPAARSATVVRVPIGPAGNPLGAVELSDGPNFGAETLATTGRAFLLAGAGAALLAAIVGLFVGRSLTRPLSGLTTAAGRMSSGDLSARAPAGGRDEIGQLAGQFNQMAERLEASFAGLAAERDALRRFIADASHQLRTPITALKNFNELLQGAAAGDPAAHAEFLAESQAQIGRLEWITRNLLSLSRLDAGLITLDLARCDAGDVIEEASAPFKALATDKGIALSANRPASPIDVQCDRARIEMALSNLLDNAVKFTPPGGRVEIGVDQAGETVRWWVRDTGPGIDPDDRPHIFERFYQGRASRASSGSGLGLAIVHSIVQAHRGRVTAESNPDSGSRFLIELPHSG